jgi:hypothetical protein
MTRVLPRTNFHSSKLIRCLADFSMVAAVEPENAFAEKLGLWVHFTDAIKLSALHNDGISLLPTMPHKARNDARLTSHLAFEKVRASVVNSIAKSFSQNLGKAHIQLPVPSLELPMDIAAVFTPYRRFYESHQRDIALSIQPLRVNLRESLANASPQLKKLAELDAALETILSEREDKLLLTVPILLKKHFEQLFKAHQQTLLDSQQADQPNTWIKAGGWLAQFYQDMQTLLLAEFELRLQPVLGLMEASNLEKDQETETENSTDRKSEHNNE